ncbi:acyl carrier protein [Candidatus Uabimicrobium sp. HlEnr_7]|uniref:acyl carrier protein n=1 Tax=Candidatus Uabimicrobium helgolandensis TaxID=3095367 RepID=UPI003555F146
MWNIQGCTNSESERKEEVGYSELPFRKANKSVTRDEIQKKIIHIVAEIASFPEEKIQGSSSLIEDIHADSLMTYEIAQEIEATFEIEIDEEDLEKIKTIDDATNHIEKRIK